MIRLEPLREPHEWLWFKERTYVPLCEDLQGIVAYRDNEIVGGCILNNFAGTCAHVHVAIDDPMVLRHGFLEAMAKMAFIDLGRDRLFGYVPTDNPRAMKLNKHMGFEVVTEIPNYFSDGVGCVIMVGNKDKAQRWLAQERRAG